jgi:hypothetical protein
MPVGKGATRRVGGQISPQPLRLGRIGAAPSYRCTIAIEGDDVPSGKVIAVVTLAGFTGSGAKKSVVGGAVFGLIVVIARAGVNAFKAPPPGRRKAFLVLLRCAFFVGIVAGGEYGCFGELIEKAGCDVIAGMTANGNISRANEQGSIGPGREPGSKDGLRFRVGGMPEEWQAPGDGDRL